jgi:hypothetical protein
MTNANSTSSVNNSFAAEVAAVSEKEACKCFKKPETCVHDKIGGKEAVGLMVAMTNEMEKFKGLCEGRKNYIIWRAEGWLQWCENELQDFIADEYVAHIQWMMYDRELGMPHPETKGDIQTDTMSGWDFEKLSDEAYEVYMLGHEQQENRVNRSIRKYWSLEARHERAVAWYKFKLAFMEKKVETLKAKLANQLSPAEQKLCDEIQDYIDQMDMENKTLLHKVRTRLRARYEAKDLTWNSWMQFTNQIHKALGWKLITSKYEVRPIDERLAYYQRGVEWYLASIKLADDLLIELQDTVKGEREYSEDEMSPGQIFTFLTFQKTGKHEIAAGDPSF